MGGIIAREICLKLLSNADDKKWIEKVRGTITVGTPQGFITHTHMALRK